MNQFPTGYEIAARSGLPVVLGPECRFRWMKGDIVLTADVYSGRKAIHILVAAHELRHALQPFWWHVLQFLPPVRWYEEVDAWVFAANLLANECANQ